VISDIIQKQFVNVDAVSGATFSSNGIIEVVANALNAGFTNPNSERLQRGHIEGQGKDHKKEFGERHTKID
jgi:Na+-transporting NADH:ubiquinone oxidoreductase subunit NqrC